MSSILLTGPAIEPLSLDEAKAFLRVEHNDDDQVFSALIAAARTHIETQLQVALITQGWRIVLDCWPQHGRIVVRPGLLKSLLAARFYDLNGNAHAIDTQVWRKFRHWTQRQSAAANAKAARQHERRYR
jgi:uncharacterized phiE125 gp8 family phage protein